MKKVSLEERCILFVRERTGEFINTQDILLAINRALLRIGEYRVLKLAYTLKGKLSSLLGKHLLSQEVLKYKDLLITATRAFDPLIIGV